MCVIFIAMMPNTFKFVCLDFMVGVVVGRKVGIHWTLCILSDSRPVHTSVKGPAMFHCMSTLVDIQCS